MSIDSLLEIEKKKLLQNGLRELSGIDLLIDGIHGSKTIQAFQTFADRIGFKFATPPVSVIGPLADKVLSFASDRYATDADFSALATRLKVPESYVRAVAEVESRGNAYLVSGRTTILFERHKFNLYLTQALASESVLKRVTQAVGLSGGSVSLVMQKVREKYPNICSASSGGYFGLEKEYDRINQAKLLDLEAAFKSASWGRFQIMGFNHKAAGFKNAVEMALAYEGSEKKQLHSLGSFILADDSLLAALRTRNFAAFARGYNGKGYAENKYDVRLDAAEIMWKKALAA